MSHLAVFESWSRFLAAFLSSHLLSVFGAQTEKLLQRSILWRRLLFRKGIVGIWGVPFPETGVLSCACVAPKNHACWVAFFIFLWGRVSVLSLLTFSLLDVPRRARGNHWTTFNHHIYTDPFPLIWAQTLSKRSNYSSLFVTKKPFHFSVDMTEIGFLW